MRYLILIAASFAALALFARIAVTHAPTELAFGLAQPLPVVTQWHGFGLALWLALAIATLVSGLGYFAYLRWLLAAPSMPARAVLAAVAVTTALGLTAALASGVSFSSDVYAYATYGELAVLGMNPYGHALLPGGIPIFNVAVIQWGNPPPVCVYGPAFVWLARFLVAATAPLGLLAQLNAFRITASLSLLGCVPLAYAATAGRPEQQRLGLAAGIALNPVLIWTAAEGHNDALMLAAALGGFTIARRAGPALGAFAIALSALIKAPAALAAFGLALALRAQPKRWSAALGGALLGLAACALLSLPLLHAASLAPEGHYAPAVSLQGAIEILTLLVSGNSALSLVVGAVLGVALAATVAAYGLRRILTNESDGWCYIALGAWLAIPNPYSWYAAWIVPIAFVAPRSRASIAVLGVAVASILRYFPDATGFGDLRVWLALSLLALAPVIALWWPE